MFCPNCGADGGSAKFCPECGAKMNISDTESSEKNTTSAPDPEKSQEFYEALKKVDEERKAEELAEKKKHKKKKAIGCLIPIILVIALIVFLYLIFVWDGKSTSNTVTELNYSEYLATYKSNKAEAAEKYGGNRYHFYIKVDGFPSGSGFVNITVVDGSTTSYAALIDGHSKGDGGSPAYRYDSFKGGEKTVADLEKYHIYYVAANLDNDADWSINNIEILKDCGPDAEHESK